MMNEEWRYDESTSIGVDYQSETEAEVYDQVHAKFRDVARENAELLDKIGFQSGHRFIEFGCGTGEFSIAAGLRGGKGYAVDVSEAMLERARAKAMEKKITSIRFVRAGFLNYDHTDEPVDFIVSRFALHHLPDYWKFVAIQRLQKMISPEGILVLGDVVIPSDDPHQAISSFIESQERVGGKVLRDDALVHFKEEFSTFDWMLEGLLDRAGFAILSKQFEAGVIALYTCGLKKS